MNIQKTTERTKKEMINDACGWLEQTDFDMEYWNSEECFCKEMFINDFRKAMEEYSKVPHIFRDNIEIRDKIYL